VLHKCANPDCSQPFKYFRHGKLFSFEMESRSGIPEKSKTSRKVLWLCGKCVRRMTLKFVKGSGLVAVPLEPHRRGVAIKPAPLQRHSQQCVRRRTMDRADAQFFSNRDRIVTQQSNSCTNTCGLTSRNSRFGDCGHGAGELTSNDPTLWDVLEARMMKISVSGRPPSGAKERKAFPLGIG